MVLWYAKVTRVNGMGNLWAKIWKPRILGNILEIWKHMDIIWASISKYMGTMETYKGNTDRKRWESEYMGKIWTDISENHGSRFIATQSWSNAKSSSGWAVVNGGGASELAGSSFRATH